MVIVPLVSRPGVRISYLGWKEAVPLGRTVTLTETVS